MDDAQRLIDRGHTARRDGNPALALELYEAAAEVLRNVNAPLRLAHTIRHVADIQRGLNLLEPAQSHYAEALAIYRNEPTTGKLDLANTLRGYALLSQSIGDSSAARAMWTEASSHYKAAEVQAGVEEAERRLATMSLG